MWLGVVNLARDHPEEAVEALDKADKLKPGDPDILYHRGRARLLVSKDSYAEMFKVDPQSWRVHRDRSIRLVMRRFMAVASAKALQVRRSAESGSSVHPSNSDERR